VGRNVLAGPMADNGPCGLRHSAITALQPAVAQRRSPMADGEERSSGGEEKGKTGGGPPKMGCESRAKVDRASVHGGRRLGAGRKLRSAVEL
jgi:hypothetical protein